MVSVQACADSCAENDVCEYFAFEYEYTTDGYYGECYHKDTSNCEDGDVISPEPWKDDDPNYISGSGTPGCTAEP